MGPPGQCRLDLAGSAAFLVRRGVLVPELRQRPATGHVYRADIDGLRALAVVPVVLYHTGLTAFHGGYIGVDIFFVISGYLITSILYRDIRLSRYSIKGFYERRIRRIFPALFAMLAVSTIAAIALLLPIDLIAFGHSVAWTIFFAPNVEFFRHSSYFAPLAITQPLLHTWSLGVEEQFYVGFPLLLYVLRRRSLRTIVIVIAALAVISLGLSIWRTSVNPDEAFYLPHTRAWELLLGSLVALAGPTRRPTPLVGEIIAFLGLALIGFSLVFYNTSTPYPGVAALAPCLGAAMLIYAGGDDRGPLANRLLALKPLTWIGLISYSLYLWHWPIFVFAHYYLVHRLSMGEQVGLVVLSVLMATASFLWVESPFRLRSGEPRPRRRIFGAAAGLSAGAAAFGLVLIHTGGLPGRFDASILRLAGKPDYGRGFKHCLWGPTTQVATRPPCEVGPAGPPTFVVWGDSHAPGLQAAFTDVAVREHRSGVLFGYGACPPLMGMWLSSQPRNHCVAYNARVLSYIKSHPSVRKVILVGRWPYYLRGRTLSWAHGETPVLADALATAGGQNEAVFRRGVERTLTALQGLSVAVLTDVPDTIESVPMVMAKQAIYHRRIDIRPDAGDFQERQRGAVDIFTAAAPIHAFALYRPETALCGPQACRVELDGRPLYADDDHLTDLGESMVEPVIARAILDGG